MPRTRPLLSRDDSQDDMLDSDEEDTLLGGHSNQQKEKWKKYTLAGLGVYSILMTVVVIALGVILGTSHASSTDDHHGHRSKHKHKHGSEDGWDKDGWPTGKRNLVFMVSDGMGPTSLSMTRSFRQYVDELPVNDTLVLDQHLVGSSRTLSASSWITDSAAGATAFSCGFKSYNGAIGVLPDHTPCGSVLEAAKEAGYMTGLVVTTRITDATPACFASHAQSRWYEDLIAEQLIGLHTPLGRTVDVIIGGGRCHFLPNTTAGSCRADSKDIVGKAEARGWNYISSRSEFDTMSNQDPSDISLPLLALVAETDIPYEIDRRHSSLSSKYPSESEMASLALSILSSATANSTKGFFLMIEGSRIDHAGHGNDPAAQVYEVLAHSKTFKTVLDFIDDTHTPTLAIGTSDHETGGLTVGRQIGLAYPPYRWSPSVLSDARHSASYLSQVFLDYLSSTFPPPPISSQAHFLRALAHDQLSISNLSPSELDALINFTLLTPPSYTWAAIISSRANIGWTTHGHTAVDVNIYASSREHARPLLGNHENIEVGRFLADYLDVDTAAITPRLRKKVKTGPKDGSEELVAVELRDVNEFSWTGPVRDEQEAHMQEDGQVYISREEREAITQLGRAGA